MRRSVITASLLLGTFLASIEVTVVATAMPSIVSQLGGLSLYPWVFSAYLLTQTVSIPLYGRLADLYGRRKTYIGGVSLFLFGALLCALSPSMPWLVAARAIQGLGAGCVLPLTMTIFGDLYEVSIRTKLQGLFSLVWGVSSVVGPLTGGAIVAHWSWQWIFWLNLPFGFVAMAVVGFLLREGAIAQSERRLDLGGAATLSGATLLLLLATLPPEQLPLSIPPLISMVGSVGCFILFILIERRHPEPLVPLDLFRDRVQVAANVAGVLLGVVLFGVISYLPLYVQAVHRGTPLIAGSLLIPLSLGWTAATVAGGRLVRRMGFQKLVRIGGLGVAVGAVLGLAGMRLDLLWLGVLGLISYGVGMGLCISSFTVSVQERVSGVHKGIATALTQFSRSIGGAVGVALLGGLLNSIAGAGIGESRDWSSDSGLAAGLTEGLDAVFLTMGVVAVLAMVVVVALFPRVEEGMRNRDELS